MSKNEFDALLLKKIEEGLLAYNPASWDKISQLLPTPVAINEFDAVVTQKLDEEEFAYKLSSWDKLAQLLPTSPIMIAEFDQSIVSKIEEDELAYNPSQWNKLAQILPLTASTVPFIKKSINWRVPTGIAAALLLLLGSALFFKSLNDNKVNDNNRPQLTKIKPQGKEQILHPNNTEETALTPQALEDAKSNNSNVVKANSGNNSTNPRQRTNFVESFFDEQDDKQVAQIISSKEEEVPVITPDVATPKHIQDLTEEAPFVIAKNKETDNNDYGFSNKVDPYYASAFYEGKPNTKKNPKTSIAVAGGVNYGNVNTGYTAGVSVRRKIAGDFFVDGTVAMMYNNNANDLINYSGPAPQGNLAARPSGNKMTVSSPAIEPTQNLYYVQFNPSFGYQIEKHVALSLGGDFQQMMKTEDGREKMQLVANSAKLFPNFDVGITAKSEFGITPNIHAGLIYREGLNNLLKSEGSKYVNRRYVQVQFKYSLPVN